ACPDGQRPAEPPRPGASAGCSPGRRRSPRAAPPSRRPYRPGSSPRSSRSCGHTTLRGATDEEKAALRAGNRALDEQQAVLTAHLVDLETLRGDAVVA